MSIPSTWTVRRWPLILSLQLPRLHPKACATTRQRVWTSPNPGRTVKALRRGRQRLLEYLKENCYDLPRPVPHAQPFSFGLGNLWHPIQPLAVVPLASTRTETLAGRPPRLLLISRTGHHDPALLRAQAGGLRPSGRARKISQLSWPRERQVTAHARFIEREIRTPSRRPSRMTTWPRPGPATARSAPASSRGPLAGLMVRSFIMSARGCRRDSSIRTWLPV